MHARRMFSVPSIYGRQSHLCDMANSSSGHKVLFTPPLLKARHPDLYEMCVSIQWTLGQSLGSNE
jgi:hypothetical protein